MHAPNIFIASFFFFFPHETCVQKKNFGMAVWGSIVEGSVQSYLPNNAYTPYTAAITPQTKTNVGLITGKK